jgi:hypothetical protein
MPEGRTERPFMDEGVWKGRAIHYGFWEELNESKNVVVKKKGKKSGLVRRRGKLPPVSHGSRNIIQSENRLEA